MSQQSLLDVINVSVSYGAIPALRNVSLDVREGEIVGVIGSNGAGKTTLCRAITGLQPVRGGDIRLGGQSIVHLSVDRRVREGIALVPQGRRVFPESSVRMNLWAGAFVRADETEISQDIDRMLELFPNLKARLDQPAGVLSGGEQQMLVIGRALMSKPRVLLLDEPSLGLAPVLVGRIFESLHRLAQDGTTMLLIEQNVARALDIATRLFVLRVGEVVDRDLDPHMSSAEDLMQRYLGID
jgi:branched-chain amino acid transport system ATP-binding protein